MRHILGAGLAAAALAGCAPVTETPVITDGAARAESVLQYDQATASYMARAQRVNAVYYPIRQKNAEICNKVTYTTGAFAMMPKNLPKSYRDSLKRTHAINPDHPVVMAVVPGTGAAQMGLEPGDQIIRHINGDEDPIIAISGWDKPDPVEVEISRKRANKIVTIPTERVCASDVYVSTEAVQNAFADGKNISITVSMLDFLKSDQELALILGHELAHNDMGHIDKMQGNRAIGAFVGAIIGAAIGAPGLSSLTADIGQGAYSQAFENEADYVGTYYFARAGYDTFNAANLWRRMGESNPASIHLEGSTHPSTAKRFLAIEATIDEIEDKISTGKSVTPNMPKPSAPPPSDPAKPGHGL